MDLVAQRASLANDYGATHGPNAPDEFVVELWIGDPALLDDYDPDDSDGEAPDAAEVSSTTVLVDEDTGDESTVANGYTSVTIPNNGTWFPAPDADGVLTTPPILFPTSLAEYPDPVTHWLLRDPETDAVWHAAPFLDEERPTIDGAGIAPRPVLAIFYNPLSGDLS